MMSVDKITEIFCIIDDFCQEFEKAKSGHILSEQTDKKRKNRSFTLSDSEVITILILFQTGSVPQSQTLLSSLCKSTFAKRIPLSCILQPFC